MHGDKPVHDSFGFVRCRSERIIEADLLSGVERASPVANHKVVLPDAVIIAP